MIKDISTWGGEKGTEEAEIYPEYGLRIGNVDITEISPKEFSDLACEAVNHLMTNGHRFETVIDETGAKVFREKE